MTDALARFVKDDGNDAIHSIQGSNTEAKNTELWLGSTTTPNNSRFQHQKLAATTDRLNLILNAINFLTLEGRDRMGIHKASPNVVGGINFGAHIGFDKLFGIGFASRTIATGVLSGVEENFIRVNAEGGPGADELATYRSALCRFRA